MDEGVARRNMNLMMVVRRGKKKNRRGRSKGEQEENNQHGQESRECISEHPGCAGPVRGPLGGLASRAH
eukprot:768656-Pyramimonas_sp.AAC.1